MAGEGQCGVGHGRQGRVRMAVHRRRSPPCPPPQTKVTVVGKGEIHRCKNLVGPFLVHKLLGPRPPPPPTEYSAGGRYSSSLFSGQSVVRRASGRCQRASKEAPFLSLPPGAQAAGASFCNAGPAACKGLYLRHCQRPRCTVTPDAWYHAAVQRVVMKQRAGRELPNGPASVPPHDPSVGGSPGG